ncbi:MAG: P-loop NTPase fold protein [Acidobacteriota bacterium]|nr:P-loop NTPase fold protein [Acidobacteriota bacterium]
MSWNNLIDVPTTQDELNLKTFADALSEFIEACETPITIGIQGDWGIGKTSLLRMVEERIPNLGTARKGHVRSVYLNTWQYAQFSDSRYMTLSLMNALVEALGELGGSEEEISSLKSSLKTAFRFVGSVVNQVVKEKTKVDIQKAAGDATKEEPTRDKSAVDFFDLPKSLKNYRDHFESLVASITEKSVDTVVIMIDDLDRLKPSSALEILEAIKNFMDVAGCVFILAVDNAIIQQGVEEKFGTSTQKAYGKSFFDKIIQVPFNMPVASYDIERYAMSLLGWKWDQDRRQYVKKEGKKYFLAVHKTARLQKTLNREDAEFFSKLCRIVAANNPRSIKRVANYANLLKMVFSQKKIQDPEYSGDTIKFQLCDAQILFALACLQMEWPEILHYLADNPSPATLGMLKGEFIKKQAFFRPLMSRYAHHDRLFNRIESFVDELINLLDQGGDGALNSTEFAPFWDMMLDTNLTNTRLESLETTWAELRKLDPKTTEIFTRSNWNDPLSLKLVPRRETIYALVFNQIEAGCLVATKKPIRFFLRNSLSAFEDCGFREHLEAGSYYTHGQTRVWLENIIDQPDKAVDLLNEIQAFLCGDR